MYGIFTSSGNGFKLGKGIKSLSNLPTFCTTRSKVRPDLIKETSLVMLYPAVESNHTPLFVPVRTVNGVMKMCEAQGEFQLVVCPNRAPRSKLSCIENEYMSCVVPSVLSYDLSGYYLSLPGNPENCTFTCKNTSYDLVLKLSKEGYDPSLSYGNPTWEKDCVYIKKL